MGKLLDLLNTSKSFEVALKIDILQTVLRVFQLDNSRKAMFRDGCGFHYLISVLSSLYDSLGPVRPSSWTSSKYYLHADYNICIFIYLHIQFPEVIYYS